MLNEEAGTDRISIFKRLTIDQLDDSINEMIFKSLLCDQYPKFVDFCLYVKSHPSPSIISVSCDIIDGIAKFTIETSDGNTVM